MDVYPWLRSDAACSPERLFCHVHGRSEAAAQIIPGWPYSFVAALTPDRTSWTAVLDTIRLGPTDDAVAVTAGQLRQVVQRLIAAGRRQGGDRNILVVMDAGYDVMRLAWLLRDLPVELVGRLRSGRALRLPAPPRVYQPKGGRPPKHGKEFSLARPQAWTEPSVATVNDTPRYGKAEARASRSITRPATATRHRSGRGPRPPARQPGRRRLRLVLLPAKIRPGTHLSSVQTVSGLDPAAAT